MNERQIGHVGVESGIVALGDPRYLSAESTARFCIFAGSPRGDGIFPVYEQVNEQGERIGLRVDLSGSVPGYFPGDNLDERLI